MSTSVNTFGIMTMWTKHLCTAKFCGQQVHRCRTAVAMNMYYVIFAVFHCYNILPRIKEQGTQVGICVFVWLF